jgi:uncharacterized protein YajQ (UPF0234 family)
MLGAEGRIMARRKQTLDDLIDQFIPEIRAAFLEAIRDIKDSVRLADFVAAIAAGDVTKAIELVSIDSAAMRPLTAAVERAFETGGIFTASQFQRPINTGVFRFDVRNSRAEAWLRDQSSKLITQVNTEQIQTIREILQDGLAKGINPRSMALDIIGRIDPATQSRVGGVIGLNGPQERAVANARIDLANKDPNYFNREMRDKRFDSTVKKLFDAPEPFPSDTADKLMTRYSDNLLKLRGETIARDQALTSLNKSEYEATTQMVENGVVDERDVKRFWDSAGDNRTRESHREMDGQERGLNEPFVTPDGARLMHPGDSSLGAGPEETINCRCKVRLQIDYFRKVNERGKL